MRIRLDHVTFLEDDIMVCDHGVDKTVRAFTELQAQCL